MTKRRLDQLLVEQGLFPSRERAQAAIMAGKIRVGDKKADKAGAMLNLDAVIHVLEADHTYVSRGALKLEKALALFGVSPAGRNALDAGASTGGFTDVLLRQGARHVEAIDVGYGQLAWKLRQDERVTVKERTNIRYVRPEDLSCVPDLIVVDLAFISLRTVLPALAGLLAPGGEAITLIKPQFEAGRELANKGVVKDPLVHRAVLQQVRQAAEELGWALVGLTYSPIKGPEGNREFLGHWRPNGENPLDEKAIAAVVAAAHEELV
jgi:23S rRNA (cytidine1920-2'-O)/16S rRNA (cytidine1409-2'-O)-methyltransferase